MGGRSPDGDGDDDGGDGDDDDPPPLADADPEPLLRCDTAAQTIQRLILILDLNHYIFADK